MDNVERMLGVDDIYLRTRLKELRDGIENNDRDILRAVRKRAKLVRDVQAVKAKMGLPVFDESRETYLNRTLGRLSGGDLTEEQVTELFSLIRQLTMPELKVKA